MQCVWCAGVIRGRFLTHPAVKVFKKSNTGLYIVFQSQQTVGSCYPPLCPAFVSQRWLTNGCRPSFLPKLAGPCSAWRYASEKRVSNRSRGPRPFKASPLCSGTILGQEGRGVPERVEDKRPPAARRSAPRACLSLGRPPSPPSSTLSTVSMAPKKKEEPKPAAAPKPPEPEPPKVPDFNPAEVQVRIRTSRGCYHLCLLFFSNKSVPL